MRFQFFETVRSPLALLTFLVLGFSPLALSGYYLQVLTLALVYAALASAWNIVGGMGGMLSLTHSVFVGTGAMLASALLLKLGINMWLGAAIAAAASALMGAFVAFVDFRFRLGHLLFALVTLAFAEMGLLVVTGWEFLGGASGLFLPRDSGNLLQFEFGGSRGAFWMMLALTAICILASLAIMHSPIGYRLRAIRDNGNAAQAIGVPLLRTKMIGMAVSACLASLVGTAYARSMTFADPMILMSPHLTIEIVLVATVGGLGRPFGPLVGSLILIPVGEILRGKFGSSLPGMHYLIYGIVVIAVVMLSPRGILPLAVSLRRRIFPFTRSESGKRPGSVLPV